jgi:hypothetical protein
MRLLVVILLLVNGLLLAYFNLGHPQSTTAKPNHEPLQPQKIKLLTPQEIEALPKKPVEEPQAFQTVASSCYEWGSFSAANLPKAQDALTRLALESLPVEKSPQEAARYWVYIPKSASLPAAQARIQKLRRLGVEESFVVFEPQWRYAISLGVFKDEQLAAKLLEDLKKKGVVSAVKGVRNQEKGQTSLLISNMSLDKVVEIGRLKPDFPGSELKQVTCQ